MEEVEEVDRAPGGGVEEDLAPGEATRQRAQVGDPCVGDDQLRLG